MYRFGKSLRYAILEVFEKPLEFFERRTIRSSAKPRHRRFSTENHEPRKTCLYDLHVENNGKIVNFSGWLLPVQYRDAIAASHQHTRTYASLFDVGHMMQTKVAGRNAAEFLESLTTADLKNLAPGAASLTIFTNETGGILDDLIITKDDEDHYYVVSNAGRRNEDSLLLNEQRVIVILFAKDVMRDHNRTMYFFHDTTDVQEDFQRSGKMVDLDYLDPLERGLIALQGPTSARVLQRLVNFDLRKLRFMNSVEAKISQVEARISRCGYTGEDGFEISFDAKHSRSLIEMLLENADVKMAGLGSRDSLRLEAGLCLYGHDINFETTPVEAALTWLVAKRRRAEGNFPGARGILEQIKTGVRKKRIGLMLSQGGPPARENAPILTPEGERVGHVTSGGPSPTLGRPIAMGYVPPELAQNGGGVLVEVRGKTYKATITKMPFVKTNYYTGK